MFANNSLRAGDTVRFLSRSRDAGLPFVSGTVGSIIAGPQVRRVGSDGAECLAYQVLFGSRTPWVPAECLQEEY